MGSSRVVASGNALGAAEAGLHRALVLVDGVKAASQVAHEKPDNQTNQDSGRDVRVHRVCSSAPRYTMDRQPTPKIRPEQSEIEDSSLRVPFLAFVANACGLIYENASSLARCTAFTTALISVTRSLPSSSSMMPSIVHPAGVVTASFSSAG